MASRNFSGPPKNDFDGPTLNAQGKRNVKAKKPPHTLLQLAAPEDKAKARKKLKKDI